MSIFAFIGVVAELSVVRDILNSPAPGLSV
jgi:hypothetical protein